MLRIYRNSSPGEEVMMRLDHVGQGQVRGCLAGLVIGDGLGMPVSGCTRAEIRTATHGRGVTGFEDLPKISTFVPPDTYGIGDTSDETAFSFACAISLARHRGFDLYDCMHAHVAELAHGVRGMGTTSRDRLVAIRDYFNSRGVMGQAPDAPPENVSLGTGVAMKIAPLAIYACLTGQDATQHIQELGRATHGDLRASLGAYPIATLLQSILGHSTKSRINRQHAIQHLGDHLPQIEFQENIWERRVKEVGSTERRNTKDGRSFHSRVRFVLALAADHDGPLYAKNVDALIECIGSDGTVMTTVPMALALFLRNPEDFDKALLEAANVGNDVDALASLVGTLVGANVGLTEIPVDLVNTCKSTPEAVRLAELMMHTNWR